MFDKVIYWCGFRYNLKEVVNGIAKYEADEKDDNTHIDCHLFTEQDYEYCKQVGLLERSER